MNWWFNALNTSFGAHEAAVARAHRSSVTGVYQWIQPNGFIVRNDGSVALPPPANIVAATAPLLELGLESGVCVPLAPDTLESGNAVKAVATLVAAAVTYNITTFIIDAEPSPGTPPSYCSAANANLYAEFLRALADEMHAHGKRAGYGNLSAIVLVQFSRECASPRSLRHPRSCRLRCNMLYCNVWPS